MRSWRKGGRRIEPQSDLMLAAMVDMMVNVLLFLLTLYGSATVIGDLQLPEGTSKSEPASEVELTITQQSVNVDGSPVLPVETGGGWASLTEDGLTRGLDSLEATLRDRRDAFPSDPPRLAVQIDRRVPWSVVEPLIRTAGDAGFVDLRFVVTSVAEP
jgi:biopolymer transport protein ExbD